MDCPDDIAGALLTIDLSALVANYRRLAARVAPADLAAVVKADAYGLGAAEIVPALVSAGCRHFFVAHLGEALAICNHVPRGSALYVLNGLVAGAEATCAGADIVPVLNSLGQAHRWRDLALRRGRPLPAVVQVDSGMSRLGLSAADAATLAADLDFRARVPLRAVMSHLACADEPGRPANARQHAQFAELAALFPGAPRSLANSGGCLLGAAFRGQIARAGIALYGSDPAEDLAEPFRPVVRLDARVIQLRTVPAGTGVGYGLDWIAPVERRLATLAIGYADGLPRSLMGRGAAWFGGVRLPIVGRVSMDSMTVDVSDLAPGALSEGDLVEIIGANQRVDDLAAAAGTISYEILTSLGARFGRTYVPATCSRPVLEAIA
ncbi:alanine racemase [Novosphingobium flavum]|uniref:Alanine racemase n=1 Tax=Novosphingobium flavum TaxID=1778672 RepID=A0A7X1FUE6_9SPHN|nr:alanine racemase [Novosphingobium flavum]MBC2667156.1 alanine racemase [Novosphingobium flavum]